MYRFLLPPSRHRALAAVAITVFAIFGTSAARAHEPNISSMFLQAEDDHVNMTLHYKYVDGDGNLGTEEMAEGAIKELGADWFEISEKPGAPFHSAKLLPGELEPAGQAGMTDWTTQIPLKPTGTWQLRLKQVYKLGAGHGEYITAKNEYKDKVAEGLLTDNTATLTIKWDDSADPTAAAANSGGSGGASAVAPPQSSNYSNYGGLFLKFLRVGVFHILTGYDHLLYLGGLLLGCKSFRSLLIIVTSFTAAHSITLALAATNTVNVPSRIIEPLIAASIVFIAVENIWLHGRESKRRWMVAFGFGLVHGFGFASTLTELGLGGDRMTLLTALFSFNLGVECGQLIILIPVVPMLMWVRRYPSWILRFQPALSLCIAAMGSYWLVTRVFGLNAGGG